MIELFDSTLRDGAQGEGISYSVRDKLRILQTLDEFGIDYIEAGNPGSNPKDAEFFTLAVKTPLKNARLAAFGSTHRRNVLPGDDRSLASLLASGAPVAVIFGKSHLLHAEKVLGATGDENLELISSTIEYLKPRLDEIIFDAEHFYDGYDYDPEYAMKTIQAAVGAGADCVTLCDTNGGMLPDRIYEITSKVRERFPSLKIGIHSHDDAGLAVADALAAVKAGASLVQGTFTGIGERCGNCDLSVMIPDLVFKCGLSCGHNGTQLQTLMETARRISDISNVATRPSKPYTGRSAFAHKGGMHIDAMEKLEGAYEHIDPSLVGNKRRLLLSEVAGRSTIIEKVKSFLPGLDRSSPETEMLMNKLKELEHEGWQFEAADASFELMTRRLVTGLQNSFRVVFYKVTDDFPSTDGKLQSGAMIQAEVDGKSETTAALGNGPVNALDIALKKALKVFYPVLGDVKLTDFKVRVLEANSTTAAMVRVLIESTDSERVWTTVGVSHDIIEASFTALCDALEYKLLIEENKNSPNNAAEARAK